VVAQASTAPRLATFCSIIITSPALVAHVAQGKPDLRQSPLASQIGIEGAK
jgi:hypothetical protein